MPACSAASRAGPRRASWSRQPRHLQQTIAQGAAIGQRLDEAGDQPAPTGRFVQREVMVGQAQGILDPVRVPAAVLDTRQFGLGPGQARLQGGDGAAVQVSHRLAEPLVGLAQVDAQEVGRLVVQPRLVQMHRGVEPLQARQLRNQVEAASVARGRSMAASSSRSPRARARA